MLTKISRKKQTLWRTAFMYVDICVGILNGFVIIPLYLKYIDLGLYGAWLATGNILMWLTIIDPGVGDVLMQKVSESYAKNNRDEIGKQLASSMILSSAIALIALSGGISLMFFIDNIVSASSSIDIIVLKKAFFYGTIGTAVTLLGYFMAGALIGLQRSKEQGLMRSIWGIINFALKPVFLILGFGLLAIPYSTLIGSVIYLILISFVFLQIVRKEKIKLILDYKYFLSYSKIFIYTFSSKMLSTLKNNVDLILISRFMNLEMVAAFELTRRPMKILYGFASRPSAALIAAFANLKGEGDRVKLQDITEKFTFLSLAGLIFITSGFIAFNKDLISVWVGSELFIGQTFNLILALFFMFSNFTYILANLTYSLGNIKGNSLIEITRDSIALILLPILGYFFGLWGIILAPFVVVIFVELVYFPKKLSELIGVSKNIIYSIGNSSIIILLIGVICSIFFYYLSIKNWGQVILYSVLFTIIFLISSFLLSRKFRETIKSARMMLISKKGKI
jgi:O-antigen/teichoic acid export membrane protein